MMFETRNYKSIKDQLRSWNIFVINKGSLRHPVYACVYRNALRFEPFKPQRIAFWAIRKIPNENVPHCVKVDFRQHKWLYEPWIYK